MRNRRALLPVSLAAVLATVGSLLVGGLTAAPSQAVINGTSAAAGDFGFLVGLIDADRVTRLGAFQAQFCGGSLTTATTVVTAAHCVVDADSGAPMAPASVEVG